MRLGALVLVTLSLPAFICLPVRAVDAQEPTTCVRQLTDSTTTNPAEGVSSPTISRDGSVVAFNANLDLTGQNPSHAQRVYVVRTDGSALRELPVPPEDEGCSPTESLSPSVSADGRYVAYDVVKCPNPPHPSQRLFSTFAAVNDALDPSGLIFPMTEPIQQGGRGINPHISADGSLLSAMSFTPAFTGAVLVSDRYGNRTTLSAYDINNAGAQITGDGRWIFLRRLCGGGINNYRIRTDGTSEAEQLGGSGCTGSLEPSDDGSKGVFTDVILDTTYLGYWEAGSDFRPLVSSTEYAVRDAAISGDGRYAAYFKDPLPRGSAYTCRLYRYDLAMNQEELLLDRSDIFCGDVSLSADGSVLAFQATGDLTDQNPDQSHEAFVATVGAACPSVYGGLPDTGAETASHPGDDASYATGCQPNYENPGDGTLLDRCTGLVWQQATAPLMPGYRWTEAIEYCEGLELGGSAHWRLPNIRELESIVDFGRALPAINSVFETRADWYQSSTSVASSASELAWAVLFGDGTISGAMKTDQGRVRCVRGGVPGAGLPSTGQTTSVLPGDDAWYSAGCSQSYAPSGEGTLADACTGLLWQQGRSPTPLTWTSAIDYCEGLQLAGESDWRLPNVRELRSITDFGLLSPALDPAFGDDPDPFPAPGFFRNYWSSTFAVGSTAFAWEVSFAGGYNGASFFDYALAGDRLFARCVRNDSQPTTTSTTTSSSTTTSLLPDADGDGVADNDDLCESTSSGHGVDPLGCSCDQKNCSDGLACNGIESCDQATGRCIRVQYPLDCDRDGDGFSTGDKCPDIFDPRQKDRDRDGRGDACDNCRHVKNADQLDHDDDGLGDACRLTRAPVIASARPEIGSPGTIVTLRGKDFGAPHASAAVTLGPATLRLVSWSPTSVQLIVPDTPEGVYSLRVTTAAGVSNATSFEVVPSGERKALVRGKINRFLKIVATALGAIALPRDRVSMSVVFVTGDVLSYESLYVRTLDQYNLAATTGLLAKQAVSAGRLQLAERLLQLGREILSDAILLERAAVDTFEGAVADVSVVARTIKASSDVLVGCLASFASPPWLGQSIQAAVLVGDVGVDLWFSGLDEGASTAMINGFAFLVAEKVEAAGVSALHERSLRTMIEAALDQPSFETVFATQVLGCGAAVSELVLKEYADRLREQVKALKLPTVP